MVFFMVLILLFAVPVLAQIETIDNGGIVDKNTQKDNEKNDAVDLDKSKYKPSGMSAVARDDGTVRLTWSDKAKGEDGYKVQRRAGSGDWQGIADLDKNSESYTDRSASRGVTYNYRVRAYNDSSNSDYSTIATVTTVDPEPLSDAEILANDTVQKKITEAVADQEKKDQAIIANLEEELRKVKETYKESTGDLEQTAACNIDVIPEDQIQAVVKERCETYPGKEQLEKAAGKTGSLLSQIFSSTKARILMSLLLLGFVLNNVWWHISHKSVRKELNHHKERHLHHKAQHEHHKKRHEKYKALHERGK